MGFGGTFEEIYPSTRPQRCRVYRISNVLNVLPKSVQPKAKQAFWEIWQAETNAAVDRVFDILLRMYQAKYPKVIAT